jgi:hypothetical protein
MLVIQGSVSGSLVDQANAMRDTFAQAVTVAITAAAEGAKLELRQQLATGSGRMDRFRNAIQARTYPKAPRFSMNAAGTVFAAGDAAERAFSAFATGAVVLPTKARALAIPVHGYRGADGRLLGPASSFFAGRLHYIPASRRAASTEVGILATRAAGRPGEIRKQLRTKGRASLAQDLVGAWIPQFILVRSARLPKILSPEQAVQKWTAQIPSLISDALAALGT